MRPYHAVLEGGGRRPGGGGLVNFEAADGNVAYAGLGGEEAAAADGEFHFLLVGILILEVGVEDSIVPFLFGIPLVKGLLRFPGSLGSFSFQAVV